MVVIAETTHLRRADTKTADSEEMLPVYVAEPGKKEGDTNIVVMIDISVHKVNG